MSKEDNIKMEGVIEDKVPGGKFKVKLPNGHSVICSTSGKIKLSNIRLVVGDKVEIMMSPYDINNGFITWRL